MTMFDTGLPNAGGNGSIKSVQRGTTLVGFTSSIAPVGPKALIQYLGFSSGNVDPNARVALTNSTTVTATGSGATTTAAWQVVDYT